jgi:hypothetical protein
MRTLRTFPVISRGRSESYDFDRIFDGKIRACERGTDFDTSAKSFRSTIQAAARRRNITARTVIVDDDTVVVQAML